MPNNNPRSPKRSWRGNQAASPRPSAGQPSWKADKPGAAGPRLSRNTRLGIVLFLFLCVVGAAVAVYFWLQPPTPFRLVLVDADYEQNLAVPPNVLGRRGLDGLEAWAAAYNKQSFSQAKKNVEVQREKLIGSGDPVHDALAKGPSDKVVVFLSAHGGGDNQAATDGRDQGAYLLPDDAEARDPAAVYRIDKALDDLKSLPEKTPKLLLLDASQPEADWDMRQLHNDFVRSVKKLEQRIKGIPNLVVFCSCDEGQQSWTSEEYGQTLFAHYVKEGLAGAADREWEGEDASQCAFGDGRITALELARYVQCQVERWVRRNRGFDQKPLLLGEVDVAAGMELIGADGSSYKEPNLADLTAWTPPDDLAKAWQEHEALANSTPPPAAYTPQQWRKYEAALLRYEQLLRDDDKAAADRVRGALDALRGQIVQAQREDRASLTNTLAAPEAFGWSLDAKTAATLKDGFDQKWRDKAKPDQYQHLLDESQAAAPDQTTRRLLRVALIGLLLDKAQLSHDDFVQVCAVLPKLDDPPAPAPAEANFAVMTREMESLLPGKSVASWDRLKQALIVRRAAESAALGLSADKGAAAAKGEETSPLLAAYSEQVGPWIQTAVAHADADRRAGEDRLFASAKEDEKANAALTAAAAAYKAVQERALVVRQAIQTRDQALAELPWYSRWQCREPLAKPDEDRLVGLWANVHELCGLLDRPDYEATATLGVKAAAVRDGVRLLHSEFVKACGDGQPRPILQRSWHELEDVLSVPLIEPELRISLLRDARRISHDLNVQTEKAGAAGADQLQDSAARNKTLAYQQARLAVAELGKDNDEGKKAADLVPPFEKQSWQPGLNEAGEVVGRGFQTLGRAAAEDAENGRRVPLKDAGALLRLAALRTRFLDAGEIDAWLSGVDPVDQDRRLRTHDLLIAEAERTRLDYWASPDATHPYYRTAGLVYAGDAEALAAGDPDLKEEQKAARQEAAERTKQQLNAPDPVAFQWKDGEEWKAKPEPLHLTDETTIQLQYGLKGPKDAPPGRPVVWAKPGAKLIAPTEISEPRSIDRLSDQPEESSVKYDLSLDRPTSAPPAAGAAPRIPPPAKEDTDFVVGGLYRGRKLGMEQMTTSVRLHNRPDLVAYQPEESNQAVIAVQASREDFNLFASKNSELVVLLDYSGSMTTKQPDGTRRIDKALEALKKCLTKLPTGVRLSVVTFQTDNKGVAPVIVTQREGTPWQPNQAGDLINKLSRLEPQGDTPLLRALAGCPAHFSPNFKGAKTIIVLTDGGDNMFHAADGTELRKEGESMKKFLHNKFDGTGVLINVVGFQLDDLRKDPAANKDEIEGLEEFIPAVKDVGGTFIEAEKADDLAKKLEQYFLQIRFWVEDERGNPIITTAGPTDLKAGEDSLNITLDTENVRPSFRVKAPESYYVLIQAHQDKDRTRSKLVDQHVRVRPGEVLILDLKDAGNNQFELRRDVYAQSYRVRALNALLAEPHPTEHNWLLSVLGNTRVQNAATRDARDVTLDLEKTDDFVPAGGTLRQSRPTLTWFNVRASDKDKDSVSGLRFYPLPNYPAPVWRLSLAEWAAGAAPHVDAWWYEDDKLPSEKELRRPRDFARPSDLKGHSFEVSPNETEEHPHVVVESAGWELRRVEVRPGEWQADIGCFVVRLRYPKDHQYFVQLPETIQPAGYEHRFYTEAHKYTAVFFGVTEAQVAGLEKLDLISVDAVREKSIRVKDLKIGQEGNPPQPIEN